MSKKKYEKLMQLERKMVMDEKKANQADEDLLKEKNNLESQNQKIEELHAELDEVKKANQKKNLRGIIIVAIFAIVGTLLNLGVYYHYSKEFDAQIREHQKELEEKEAILDEQMKNL